MGFHVRRPRCAPGNSLQRSLVESPDLWRWSTYRAYFLCEIGIVKINEWDVLKMKIRIPAA
jgi:hypothetical protein